MTEIITAIIIQLECELATAIKASEEAHSSATHSENIASNKYDTLAVEAAYLAHGQSLRIAELQEAISIYRGFQRPGFNSSSSIVLGALVDIETGSGERRRLFVGPSAGGLCVGKKPDVIQVITTATPLGKALLDKMVDDEIELTVDKLHQIITVIDIH